MRVLLMRHGQTAANVKRLYNGRTDDPLCDEGVNQATLSGTDPKTKCLYASPMKRALETARIKFPNAEITVTHALREMNFGDFEGRGYEELKLDATYQSWVDSGGALACPNGDKMSDFSDRVCSAFDALVLKCVEQGDEELVIVAHGGTLMAILGRYARPERPYYEWYVDNCCGYRAEVNNSSWSDAPALTDCTMFETL